MLDVSAAFGAVAWLSFIGGHAAQELESFVQRNAASRGDVKHFPGGLRSGVARQQIRFHRVVDVSEIAALFAVAENRGLLSAQHWRNELGEYARILRRWVLVRSEDIEVTQRHCFQSVAAEKRDNVMLARQL